MKKKKFSWTKRFFALLVLSGIGVAGMESYHHGFVAETIGRVVPAWRANQKDKQLSVPDEKTGVSQSISQSQTAQQENAGGQNALDQKHEALPAPLNPVVAQKANIPDVKKETSQDAASSAKSLPGKISANNVKAADISAVPSSPAPKGAESPSTEKSVKPSSDGSSSGTVNGNIKQEQPEATAKSSSEVSTALFEDLVNAYIYAYPFVLMNTMESEMTKSLFFAPKNKMAYFTVLPSPHIKVAECPNVDSLMSTAWLDLTTEPQVVCMPASASNSYIMELVDAWTNVVNTFGGNQTSDFPVAELDGRKIKYFIAAGPSTIDKCPKGSKVIVSPTNNLWLINRVLFGAPRSENDPGIAATARTLYEFEIVPLKLFEKEVLKKTDAKTTSSKINRIKRLKIEQSGKDTLEVKKNSGVKITPDQNNSLKIQNSPTMKNSRTNSEKLLPLIFPSASRSSLHNSEYLTLLTGETGHFRMVKNETVTRLRSQNSSVSKESTVQSDEDENDDDESADDSASDDEEENIDEVEAEISVERELPDADNEISEEINQDLKEDTSLPEENELDDDDELEESEELDMEPENPITFVQYRRSRGRDYNTAFGQRNWNTQSVPTANAVPQATESTLNSVQPTPYQQHPSYSQQVPTVIIESVQTEGDVSQNKPDTKLRKIEKEGVNALEDFHANVDSEAKKAAELTEKAGSKLKEGVHVAEQTIEKAGHDIKNAGKKIEKISDKAWDKTKDAAKESVDLGRNAAEYMDRRFRRDAARFANHLGFWFDWTSRTEMPVDKVERMSPEEFFGRFAKAYVENPLPAGDQKMDELLKKLGLTLSANQKEISPNAQVRYLMRFATPYAQGRINQKAIYGYCQAKKVNNWYIPENFGRYGADYLRRAIVANEFIGTNVPEQILYPFTLLDGKGEFLSGTDNYVLHFPAGQTPPANLLWSITMYDQRRSLVANRLDRYAIRSNLPLVYNQDGSLDILISHEEPNENLSNWLPAPKGEFMLMMRIYQPKKEALNGQWQIPPVIKVGPSMKKNKDKI